MKKEIERRIEVIPKIQYEPQLISDPRYIMVSGNQVPPHYYRLKAVDDIKSLGNWCKLYKNLNFIKSHTNIFLKCKERKIWRNILCYCFYTPFITETEISRYDNGLKRHPTENLRAFLLSTLAAPLNGSSQRLVHQFCDLYEQARHDPTEFGDEEYQVYTRLLMKLTDAWVGASFIRNS